ncbi:MAG: hypothetical protein U0136_07490 [Bdellovibrionota bacterium]
MSSRWENETNSLHLFWPGRENPMGYLNLMTFYLPSFYKGGYGPVFTGIMNCWKAQSFGTMRRIGGGIGYVAD